MSENKLPVVYTPDNEPYLGRKLLYHFDQLIIVCLEQNTLVAPKTHKMKLSANQAMACQVIPQTISIALSIRELVRQGYLFGAHVLLRSMTERAMMLLYLHYFPQKIDLWNQGWKHREAPSLSKMIEEVKKVTGNTRPVRGHEVTKDLNSLVHGKPDSVIWNLVEIKEGKFGHAPSKILDNPSLCDELCANTLPWLAIVPSMICAYFPNIDMPNNIPK